jgi:hypothetical protein
MNNYITLAAWILKVMISLQPMEGHHREESLDETKERYKDAALKLALVMQTEKPLPGHTLRETALAVLGVASIESHFRNSAEDIDGTKNCFCFGQIKVDPGDTTPEGWTGVDLAADRGKCWTRTWRILREKWGICGYKDSQILAAYQGNCHIKKAREGSVRRIKRIKYLWKKWKSPVPDEKIRADNTQSTAGE